MNAPIAQFGHDNSAPYNSSTAALSHHPISSVQIHTSNNNNDLNLGLEDLMEMDGEEDADGETDDDENNKDNPEGEVSDDESEKDDNEWGDYTTDDEESGQIDGDWPPQGMFNLREVWF
ncbi:uncharacterized protein MELLADRAFT_64143 [Melampsora larici-populina 98AG31]|uniref:Uncharacterized protein n=1 Tax=Melampsora larici-populina (strain 98AG31 / pathotype 3-4-7) TaxID=747676 RepID=F4RQ65_MELLP|nr:uncharacterized protein MELLADRAFT_64143 [Melampsora larici-populina 98AG31]EGG05460.1 hypothetical protein MELLADRAFT_64143 [Melampsora larici-populina 98AG31]